MSKASKFYDIYDFIYVPFWKTKLFLVIISSIAFILFALGVYFFIKRLREKRKKAHIITPWEWALGELESLAPDKYTQKEEFKKFYFEVTRIVKAYLQARYKWNVIEKTDDELILYLRGQGFDKTLLDQLSSVLEGSLLVKFANEQALQEQAKKDLSVVSSLVEITKPLDNI